MASTVIDKDALVIGAGMGGLAAAGVLSKFFEHVVVLERDELTASAANRQGTPSADTTTHCWPAANKRSASCFAASRKT